MTLLSFCFVYYLFSSQRGKKRGLLVLFLRFLRLLDSSLVLASASAACFCVFFLAAFSVSFRPDLWLGRQPLKSLPESFGSLTIGVIHGCDLYLNFQLESLAESFGSFDWDAGPCKISLYNTLVAESLTENSFPGLWPGALELWDGCDGGS